MPVITDDDGDFFEESPFDSEAAFESEIIRNADSIFGPNSIYVDVKKRVKGNGIITIPDGYVIDMTAPNSPELFIIENEIASHDSFRHIGIQLLKFVTSFQEAQPQIRRFLMDEISRNESALTRLECGCGQSDKRNIDNYLDSAVYGPFRGIVIIDYAKPELHNVLRHINANISVLEFRTYRSSNGSKLFQFDTLYDELQLDEVEEGSNNPAKRRTRQERKNRRAHSDTIIVPAQKDGFERVFLGENRWYAIRVGAAMKDKIKYIAAYQVRPISAVTHIAPVQSIVPYEDTGKYLVTFKEPAKKLENEIPIASPNRSPQAPIYTRLDALLKAKTLEDALS